MIQFCTKYKQFKSLVDAEENEDESTPIAAVATAQKE